MDIPPQREGWKSFQFNIHYFEVGMVMATKGDYFYTPEFSCNGHRWALRVSPCGTSQAEDGWMSIFLYLRSEGRAVNTYEVKMTDRGGGVFKKQSTQCCYESTGKKSGNKGWPQFRQQSDIPNFLDEDGTLTLTLSMKEEKANSTLFIPKNSYVATMLSMFNDEETADVCFDVCNIDANEDETKKAKTSVTFHAHKCIIKKCAPMLANLFESNNNVEEIATIIDVEPHIFRHLLFYVYGGSVNEDDLKSHAREIIDAADKYSIVNLKLEAEAAYAKSKTITTENVKDILLYADAKNCALLKEAVFDFLAQNGEEVIAKLSFSNIPGHLMKDLLVVTTRKGKEDKNEVVNDLNMLRVNELRLKLHEKGLNVDGSREAMIAALKSLSPQG
jgi:hypothetical protein